MTVPGTIRLYEVGCPYTSNKSRLDILDRSRSTVGHVGSCIGHREMTCKSGIIEISLGYHERQSRATRVQMHPPNTRSVYNIIGSYLRESAMTATVCMRSRNALPSMTRGRRILRSTSFLRYKNTRLALPYAAWKSSLPASHRQAGSLPGSTP